VEAGAEAVGTAREVAAQADVVFGMVSDPDAALAIAGGPDGVAAGLTSGKGYVDVSTVDAATARAVEALVAASGAAYLEAPVSGSKGPAENGQLIFLCGGDEALFKSIKDSALDVMGKASFFLGACGRGAQMKLVVNMVMGTWMASLSEGMHLADAAGLDAATLTEVLGLGAMACPMIALKAPIMATADGTSPYPAAFPLKHQQKDLRLALALGDETSRSMPVAAAAMQQYVRASARGRGEEDFAAVHEAGRE